MDDIHEAFRTTSTRPSASLSGGSTWPAGDYVERTVASIMAEVVAPARDE